MHMLLASPAAVNPAPALAEILAWHEARRVAALDDLLAGRISGEQYRIRAELRDRSFLCFLGHAALDDPEARFLFDMPTCDVVASGVDRWPTLDHGADCDQQPDPYAVECWSLPATEYHQAEADFEAWAEDEINWSLTRRVAPAMIGGAR